MTRTKIAMAVEFEASMLRFARAIKHGPAREEHRNELLKLEALIICMMNAKPSNVVNIFDYRRVS